MSTDTDAPYEKEFLDRQDPKEVVRENADVFETVAVKCDGRLAERAAKALERAGLEVPDDV